MSLIFLANKTNPQVLKDICTDLTVPEQEHPDHKMMSLHDLMKHLFPDDGATRKDLTDGIDQLAGLLPKLQIPTTQKQSFFTCARHCEAAIAVRLHKIRDEIGDGRNFQVFIGVSQRCCAGCQLIL